jgi:calcineurin-like phosphoesterase family protein
MEDAIIANWNRIVGVKAQVFVVGDVCFRDSPFKWLSYLNGYKILIRGNHDKVGLERLVIVADDIPLMLVHSPYNIGEWDGWVIHGHTHDKSPFINYDSKMINVSVEAMNYKPVLLANIINNIKGGMVCGIK